MQLSGEPPAGDGQLHLAMQAAKQRATQVLLERADMPADCRLRDVQFTRRVGEAQAARSGIEGAQCQQ